jgi:protein CpxP
MKMKATIILSALLSAGTLLAQAPNTSEPAPAQSEQSQTNYPPRNVDPAKQAANLGQKLGLSADQIAQITPIIADRQQKVQSLRAEQGLSRRELRKRAKAIMTDSTQKLEAVLTDSQKQQYEKLIAERRSQRGRYRLN